MSSIQQPNQTPADLTDEALAAVAAELGIPLDQLKAPPRPQFKADKGYHLEVTKVAVQAVKNGKHKGARRVQMNVSALDAAGKVVKRASGFYSVNLPFMNPEAGFNTLDAETREKWQSELLTFLRLARPAEFGAFAKVVALGDQKHYFAADGTEYTGEAIANQLLRTRIKGLQEIATWRTDPAKANVLKGTRFFAKWTESEIPNSDVVYKRFYSSGDTQLEGVEYITDPRNMMVSGATPQADGDAGEETAAEDTADLM